MHCPKITTLLISVILLFSGQLLAAENTPHQDQSDQMKDMDMTPRQKEDIFLENRIIDGYTVYFHIMKVSPDVKLAGDHNFMVKIENQGKILGDVTINSKIIYPSGRSESKFLNKMGDWYMKDFTLDENGKYQLIILFKTADGKKHKGGVYYERPGSDALNNTDSHTK